MKGIVRTTIQEMASSFTRAALLLSLLVLLAPTPYAAIIEINEGDSFEAAVEALTPGDTLIVHEGTYSEGGTLNIRVKGTASEPVVVKGADGEARPHITRPANASTQNTINIDGASYVTIKGLEISSNGGNAIKMINGVSYITLEDLDIHDIDVGIRVKSADVTNDSHHLTIRRNHIYRIGEGGGHGEGMYVGCNAAACVVRDSLIEGNWIHDTLQASQGDGIEIKRGSHSNIVRNNVIHDTNFPCILIYGTEGSPRNLVEGNVMWNCGDSGIQAAADAVIRNNIILASPSRGFNSQDHQGVTPNNLEFVHNTVVGGAPCLKLADWSNKQGMVFANNAIYCESDNSGISGLTDVVVSGNVVVPSISQFPSGGYTVGRSVDVDFIDAVGRNVYPTADSALIDAGDPSYVTGVDFNGTPRTGTPDAGAYTWTTEQNPGWTVAPGFKDGTPPDTTTPAAPTGLEVR